MSTTRPLHILILEDNLVDADVLSDTLTQEGFEFESVRVETETDFINQLSESPDLILADFSLPQFNALQALKLLQDRGPDIPFIIVTGTVSEEMAVACIKQGAADYLLKDRLTRLGQAVVKALADKDLRENRRKAAKELAASEIRYRRLFEAAQDGILILDANTGKVVDVNPFLLDLLGYSKKDFLGKQLWELGLFKDIFLSQESFRELHDKGYIRYEDLPLETRDGRRREVEFVSNVYFVNEQKVIQCNIRDVSDRKRADKKTAELAAIVQSSQDGIYGKNLDGIITSWNSSAERMYGYSESEIVGKSVSILVPPERAEEVTEVLEKIRLGKTIENFETLRQTKSGQLIPMSITISPILDTKGRVVAASTICRDITERKRAEIALSDYVQTVEEMRLFLQTTLDAFPTNCAVLDPDGTIINVNASWSRFADQNGATSPRHYLGANYLTVCDTAVGPMAEQAIPAADGIRAVIEGRQNQFFLEYPCNSASENRWFILKVTPFPESAPRRVVITHINISERKRAEDVSQAERNLLRTLIDHIPDYIFIKDTEGRFVLSNAAHAHFFQLEPPMLLGRTALERLGPEWNPAFEAEDLLVLQAGQALIDIERTTTDEAGNRHYWLLTKVPLRDQAGQIIGLIGVSRDITKSKRADEALRESERKLRRFVEESSEGIVLTDEQGMITEWNHSQEEITGWSRAQVLGQPLWEVQFALGVASSQTRFTGAQLKELLVDFLRTGEAPWAQNPVENEIRQADGSIRIVQLAIFSIATDKGHIAASVINDITERKRAEEALKQSESSEREQRTLAEALLDSAATLTSTLDPTVVMNRILENVGRVISHDSATIMLIDGDSAYIAYWRGYSEDLDSYVGTKRLPLDNAPLRQMMETHLPIFIDDVTVFPGWAILPDTSRIRSYAAAPIQAHNQIIGFLNIDGNTPRQFSTLDAKGLQAFADQAAIAIENAQLYDELRRRAVGLEERVELRTAELQLAKEHLETLINSSTDAIVVVDCHGLIIGRNPSFTALSGFESDDNLGQSLVALAGLGSVEALTHALSGVIDEAKPRQIEFVAQNQNGRQFDGELVLSPIVDVNNQTAEVICNIRDITPRKQMEIGLRQTVAKERELGELKSRFLSMASHDFRTPLAVILSAASVLKLHYDKLTAESRLRYLDNIHVGVNQMTELLEDVLAFTQGQDGHLKFRPMPLDLEALCRQMLAETQIATGKSHDFVFSSSGSCSDAVIDTKLVRQILINLLSNAAKYAPEGSMVDLNLLCESGQAVFRVQDHGIGIPEKDQARLFEPFHRADNADSIRGTGLGLAIVKRAVELHGGTIAFESQVGIGTTFTVVIPTFQEVQL